MLYWIWFVVLTIVGWGCAYRSLGMMEKDEDYGTYGLCSFCSMTLAAALSWDVLGIHIFNWVKFFLPQKGTSIHDITSLFIMALIFLFWIFHPIFLLVFFMTKEEQNPSRN